MENNETDYKTSGDPPRFEEMKEHKVTSDKKVTQEKINFSLNSLTDTVTIKGKPYQLFQVDQLETLIAKLKEYESDTTELKSAVLGILNVLGLLDPQTQTIKASIQSGEESYLKNIMKAMNKLMLKLPMAGFSKPIQRELEEQFSFIKTILPVINKYGAKS